MVLLATVEFALAVALLPVACGWRALRHWWPVEVFDGRGRRLEISPNRTWDAAGWHVDELRRERGIGSWR